MGGFTEEGTMFVLVEKKPGIVASKPIFPLAKDIARRARKPSQGGGDRPPYGKRMIAPFLKKTTHPYPARRKGRIIPLKETHQAYYRSTPPLYHT